MKHKKFFGYTKDDEENLIIGPDEAVFVKRIFREYLEGISIIQIAKGLKDDGIKTVTGLENWYPGTIDKKLSNEKFCGDACMQKTYNIDFLTKKKVKNQGYAPQYYIEDNHEAIIPKELFHQIQLKVCADGTPDLRRMRTLIQKTDMVQIRSKVSSMVLRGKTETGDKLQMSSLANPESRTTARCNHEGNQ